MTDELPDHIKRILDALEEDVREERRRSSTLRQARFETAGGFTKHIMVPDPPPKRYELPKPDPGPIGFVSEDSPPPSIDREVCEFELFTEDADGTLVYREV